MLGFLEAGYGNVVLAVVCFLGMAGTWMAGRRYRRLTLEMENMSGNQSKYLKQMKNKFETSYRVNQGVNNVGLFVERNVREFRFLGMKLYRLANTAVRAGSFAFLLGCAAALFCYQAGMALSTVGVNLAFSLLLAAAALLYGKNASAQHRARDFCIHIQDYLENVLTNRLAATVSKENRQPEKFRERDNGRETIYQEYNGKETGFQEYGEKETVYQEYGMKEALTEYETADAPAQACKDKDAEEEISYLKQSLDRIASGREIQGDDERPRRKKGKLSAEEQGLIEEILREYFA